jgi:hypothetical protein
MNDDLHPSDTPSDELLAVNALIDGTATAADQATVEVSPELQRSFEELQRNRIAVAQVHVQHEDRETAIAAALAVFDDLSNVTTSAAGTTPGSAAVAAVVVPLHGRPARSRQYRFLMAAAAAVAVLFVGAAVLNGRGSNDQASSAADAAAKVSDTTSAAAEPLAASDAATSMQVGGNASTEAAATTAGAGGVEVATSAPTVRIESQSTIGGIPGPADPSVPLIADENGLRTFSSQRAALPVTDGMGFSCVPPGADVLGQVVYQGIDAVVVRDPATRVVTVFDLATCAVITSINH